MQKQPQLEKQISYQIKGSKVLVKVPKIKKPKRKVRSDKGKIVEIDKLDLFLAAYDKHDGNGTEAAMEVFNCTTRISAANMASSYLKKAQALGRYHLEKKGATYSVLIDKALKRMDDPKAQDFVPLFDRMMKLGDFEDFLTKQGVSKIGVSVLGVQKKLMEEYVEGEVIEDEDELSNKDD